jgi:putative membrane protein
MSITKIFARTIPGLAFVLAAAMAHAQSAPSTGTSSSGTSAPSGASSTLNAKDKKMMVELAQGNMSEIAVAKLAQQQTKNPEVLSFAQKMIDDHTKAGDDLAQLAQSKGVTLPTQPDSKHQAIEKKLSKLSGEAFDRQYLAHAGVEDHKQTVALLERISKQASDPDLKALADKTLPVVEQHLHTATQDESKEKSR